MKWPVSGACQTWLGSAGQRASLFGWCLDEDTPPAAGRDWLDGSGRGCAGVGEDWKEGDEVRRPWMVREFFFFNFFYFLIFFFFFRNQVRIHPVRGALLHLRMGMDMHAG